MAFQIMAIRLFVQQVVQNNNTGNIAPHHSSYVKRKPLWFASQRTGNVGSASMSQCLHVAKLSVKLQSEWTINKDITYDKYVARFELILIKVTFLVFV